MTRRFSPPPKRYPGAPLQQKATNLGQRPAPAHSDVPPIRHAGAAALPGKPAVLQPALPVQYRQAGTGVVQRMLSSRDEAVAPFLRDEKGTAKFPEKSVTGKNPRTTGVYLYHVTTFKNLLTIKTGGLDPNYGGSGKGVSDLADTSELVESSLKGSKGFIHGATKSLVVNFYAEKFDKKADEPGYGNRKLDPFAVVLRFPADAVERLSWENDTEDRRGNYKTAKPIPPEKIEFLDVDGWQPVKSITELSAALGG